LFEPDVLATEEYCRTHRRHTPCSEQVLMGAVLEQGITDCRRYVFAGDRKGRKLFLDAVTWISFDDHDWVFSFANCCTALGIDPGSLRHGAPAAKPVQRENFSQSGVTWRNPKDLRRS
jgi:hypothetical protein